MRYLLLSLIVFLILTSCKGHSKLDLLCGKSEAKRLVIKSVNNEQRLLSQSWVFTKDGYWYPNDIENGIWELTDFGDQVFDYSYEFISGKEKMKIKVFAQDFKVIVLTEDILEIQSEHLHYKFYAADF